MKSMILRAFALLGMIGAVAIGCQGQEDGDDALDDELAANEGVQPEEQDFVAVPMCQDLVLHQVFKKICGNIGGPELDPPLVVTCTRTCTTDRYIIINPPSGGLPGGGGISCGNGETTCTPWACPPC